MVDFYSSRNVYVTTKRVKRGDFRGSECRCSALCTKVSVNQTPGLAPPTGCRDRCSHSRRKHPDDLCALRVTAVVESFLRVVLEK